MEIPSVLMLIAMGFLVLGVALRISHLVLVAMALFIAAFCHQRDHAELAGIFVMDIGTLLLIAARRPFRICGGFS